MKTDVQLKNDVMEEIKFDPMLSQISSEIGVMATDGVITLTGRVESFLQRHALESAVLRVHGVHYVAMEVETHLGSPPQKRDSSIAQAIKVAFRNLSSIDEKTLDVRVEEGYVTLEGTQKWNYQRLGAEEHVRNIDGVVGIDNRIQLKNERQDAHMLKEKIISAFHRHAAIDADKIQVRIDGQQAILSGKVRSWTEKKDAEKIAWRSPGIASVTNDIVVEQPYVH